MLLFSDFVFNFGHSLTHFPRVCLWLLFLVEISLNFCFFYTRFMRTIWSGSSFSSSCSIDNSHVFWLINRFFTILDGPNLWAGGGRQNQIHDAQKTYACRFKVKFVKWIEKWAQTEAGNVNYFVWEEEKMQKNIPWCTLQSHANYVHLWWCLGEWLWKSQTHATYHNLIR